MAARAEAGRTHDPGVGRDGAGHAGEERLFALTPGLWRTSSPIREEAGQVDRPASGRDDVGPLLLESEREGCLGPSGGPGGRAQRRGAGEEHPDKPSHPTVRFPSSHGWVAGAQFRA